MAEDQGPFRSAPRFEGASRDRGPDVDRSGNEDPPRVPGVEQKSVMSHEDHKCRGTIKVYDYGTSYCDPAKGGCGRSRGIDGNWRE